ATPTKKGERGGRANALPPRVVLRHRLDLTRPGTVCASRQHLAEQLAQALTRHVQPTLDGADRRVELAAHLLERTAAQVERLEGVAVRSLQAAQTRQDLGAVLIP